MPVSIAVTETLLLAAVLTRTVKLAGNRTKSFLPRVFWFWLAWAVLEILVWSCSPDRRIGQGEIRHLFLIAALFFVLPALDRLRDRVAVWQGLFFTATLSSIFLIGTFLSRLLFFRSALDPVMFLRTGGLLHHWMIYGIVEILVFAGLLEFRYAFPEECRWWPSVMAINGVAILLSLTRMLWICCLLLLALHLGRRRSRWIWAVPALPFVAFLVAPGPVRDRIMTSLHPSYYSNAERVQMALVGWKMVRGSPLTGVGPGRVDQLYTGYLSPADPVPAYHGHLHNNFVQLAAEFGLPVAGMALLFVGVLWFDLRRSSQWATNRSQEFLCRTAVLGLVGFLAAGMFDYTYGHSLALILLSFVVLMPLIPATDTTEPSEIHKTE